jgi:hypothetical protein
VMAVRTCWLPYKKLNGLFPRMPSRWPCLRLVKLSVIPVRKSIPCSPSPNLSLMGFKHYKKLDQEYSCDQTCKRSITRNMEQKNSANTTGQVISLIPTPENSWSLSCIVQNAPVYRTREGSSIYRTPASWLTWRG